MNGPARKIEILAPFNQAIELTRLILFRPFDVTKWLVIGFAAFLSGWFNSGGGSLNPWSFRRWNSSSLQAPTFQFRSFNMDHAGLVLSIAVAVFVVVLLVLVILWLWVVARGRFIFIDCLVRNRAAIVEPWREFGEEGNRFFVFLIVLMLISLVFLALIGGLIFALFVWFHTFRASSVPALFVFVPIAVFVWVAFAIAVNLITYFMPAVMYRRRCSPLDAARAILQLVFDDPAPFILFLLFMVALWIGWIMVGCLVTCGTCCLASLPYIGTVIVLPVPVLFRSFSLLFLRQFGPEWDVWAKIPLPAGPAAPTAQTAIPASPSPPIQETDRARSTMPPLSATDPERSPYEPPESPPPPQA